MTLFIALIKMAAYDTLFFYNLVGLFFWFKFVERMNVLGSDT